VCRKDQKIKTDFGRKNADLGEIVEGTAYVVLKAALGNDELQSC
jgi:hypothetical protein